MRTALAVILFLLAVSALAQDQSAVAAAESACGPQAVEFQIKTDTGQHPLSNPTQEKRRCMSSWIKSSKRLEL